MAAPVLLLDIVDALEMQFDEATSFLDLDTGHIETISEDLLRLADEGARDEPPEISTWQKQEWDAATRIVSSDRFEKLPTKFDVHEWAIMRDFSQSLQSNDIRQDLLSAIHGPGAFRCFKDAIRRHNIASAWFTFRTDALKQIAIEWCEEHHVIWR